MKNIWWRVRLIVRHGAGSWVKLDTSQAPSYRRARVEREAIRDGQGRARATPHVCTREDVQDISYRIVATCKKYLNVGREGETVGRVVLLSERYVSA